MTDTIPTLPPLADDTYKHRQGKLLIIAGSRGMTGAALLCGEAALRSGAGLVYAAVPSSVGDIVDGGLREMITLYQEDDGTGHLGHRHATELLQSLAQYQAVCMGPGLGLHASTQQLVRRIIRRCPVPLVIDADAITAVAGHTTLLKKRTAPTVITPHGGEFLRLSEGDKASIATQDQRKAQCESLAKTLNITVLLKGPNTVISDGQQTTTNTTGNPGLATAGTGDVLTGIIGSLLAQGLDAFTAAKTGAYIHGQAGDKCAEQLGQREMIAGDLLKQLNVSRKTD